MCVKIDRVKLKTVFKKNCDKITPFTVADSYQYIALFERLSGCFQRCS